MLVATEDKPGWLYFVRRKGLRGRVAIEIDAVGGVAGHESRFLSETLLVTNKSKKLLLNFNFHRGQFAAAEAIAGYLQDHEGTEERMADSEAVAAESEKGEGEGEEVAVAANGDDAEPAPEPDPEPGVESPDVDVNAEVLGEEEIEAPLDEGIGLRLRKGEERNSHEPVSEEPEDPEPDAPDASDEARPSS